jgi:serine/threonine protein kinase
MTDGGRQTEALGDTVRRSESSEPGFTLREGDVLLERFKLVRLVGRGGMGEVYEARDLTLQTTIALKTVRSSLSASAELVGRLRREVTLARTVTHPNVCRLFDLHEGPGPGGRPLVFITMEYPGSGFPNYLVFSKDPLLDPIRSDPGFIQFMAELKPRWERWTAAYR